MNYFFMFATGGIGYNLIELMWRGYTHWSMTIVGGIGLVSIYAVNTALHARNIFARAIVCGLLISVIEFSAGVILNLWLGWNIWSYAKMPLNLLGQVCLVYSTLWTMLSIPVLNLLSKFSSD